MKVPLPLSLKVSLWLLLNLLALGAAGFALLLAPGGPGWGALMNGPAGNHAQGLADTVIAELNAVRPAQRDAALARLSHAHGVAFLLFDNTGPQLAGAPTPLPPAVREFVVPPARRAGPPPRDPEFDRPPPRDDPGEPPPRRAEDGPPGREPRAQEEARQRGRFMVEADGFWVGLRVPFIPAENPRPHAATLLARVPTRWGLLRLLDLQSWLLAGGGVLGFSALLWLPFVRGLTRALARLTVATEKISEGRFDTRVPEDRRDELGALGGSVNRMAARLDTLVHGQKRFLADVAHELGSPLGRLQVATEILESRADPALQPQIADVREEVQQMGALVNELLAFTKAGLRPRDAALAAVPLAPLVERVLAREDPGQKVRVELAPGVVVLADADLLARALGNLVRNALRYAGDAGPVAVTARAHAGGAVVLVTDEGPGVPAAALARLGEPFYRPELARTRETGGAGLGLAIVRNCAEACRGRVVFRNRAPRGFEAELQLASPAA